MRIIAVVALLALQACAPAPAPPPHEARYAPRIERDEFGVPTVHGATDPEVAYGLAVAHAEDDFATIQRVVLAARGRLGAVEGEAGARSDFFFHLLRVEDAVAAGYERDLSAETRALLDGYAAGLNAYGAAHPDEVLAGARNVRGRDVAAGFTLTSPLFFGLDGVVGALLTPGAAPCAETLAQGPADGRGSNAFAIAPARSEDGRTRLIVNSHQPWNGPVAWWEARLRSETGWSMGGGFFAGSPVPLLGHNRDLGWAATVNFPDLVDLYRLTTDEDRPGRYLFDGAWRDFAVRTVWLSVRVGPLVVPIPRTIRFTVHGPVFETADGWVAVRYANAGDVRAVEQYYRMGRARNFTQWRDALSMRAIPSTNLVYADGDGRIAYFYNASIPRRAPGHDWRRCVVGDSSAALDDALVPIEEIPHLVDPPSGWLYNANATPFSATDPSADLDPAAFAADLGLGDGITNRARRIVALLAPDARISDADLLAAKFDTTYDAQSEMGRLVAEIVALDLSPDARLAEAQALLRGWDRRVAEDRPASALALLTYAPIYEARVGDRPSPGARAAFEGAVRHLIEIAGRIDPPLSEMLRLRRGDVDVPVVGGPDLPRAIGWSLDSDGRMRADFGDGLIMVVEWSPDGAVRSRTIHQFGAAIGRPESPHFADQAPLFARREFRERSDRRAP